MHLVLGVIPAGKGRKGLGPAGVAIVLPDSPRGKRDTGTQAPQPRSNMAGGRCTVQLFPALALPDQGVNTPTTHLAAGASEAKKRGTCRPPSFLSHLHFSLSADWPVKRRSPPASHTVAAQSCRHWFQRLSVKLVAHVLAPGVTLFLMDWLHAGPPIPSSTTTHTYTRTDTHTHTQRKAIIKCRRMLGA